MMTPVKQHVLSSYSLYVFGRVANLVPDVGTLAIVEQDVGPPT